MKPEPNEQELAIRVRNGDRNALEELIEGARLRLFALAYAELRHYEDAQDVVASALLQICRHAHTLRSPDAIRAWMNSIVRNEARRLRRGDRGQAPLDSVAEIGTADTSPFLRIDIERALCQLPNDQARAIGLFHFSEQPIAEIARQFGRPEGTIKRWLHQGRQQLATEMKGYGTMRQEWTATVLTDEMTEDLTQKVSAALATAGWNKLNPVREVPTIDALYTVQEFGEQSTAQLHDSAGNTKVFTNKFDLHLSPLLAGSQMIVMTEHIAGQSAFELISILQAMEERKDFTICLLLDVRAYATVYATFLHGVDLSLTMGTSQETFARCFREQRNKLEARS